MRLIWLAWSMKEMRRGTSLQTGLSGNDISHWILFLFTDTDVIFGEAAATHSGWWWSHRLTTIQVCSGFWIYQYCRKVGSKSNLLVLNFISNVSAVEQKAVIKVIIPFFPYHCLGLFNRAQIGRSHSMHEDWKGYMQFWWKLKQRDCVGDLAISGRKIAAGIL
jgi:hypothetical protein